MNPIAQRPLLRRSMTSSSGQQQPPPNGGNRTNSMQSLFNQQLPNEIPSMEIEEDSYGQFCLIIVQDSNGRIFYIRDHDNNLTLPTLEDIEKIPMSIITNKLYVVVDGEQKLARSYQKNCFDKFNSISEPFSNGSFSKIMKFKSVRPIPQTQEINQSVIQHMNTSDPLTNTMIRSQDWFKHLFGFDEMHVCQQPDMYDVNMTAIKSCFEIEGSNYDTMLRSRINNSLYGVGKFTTPTLGELREEVDAFDQSSWGQTTLSHIAGDSFQLHYDPQLKNAAFQAASQFNCLEFVNPSCTPEHGVTNYVSDNTQGPACALAAPAGTVYRNYYANCNGKIGQSKDNQINNLNGVLEFLGAI